MNPEKPWNTTIEKLEIELAYQKLQKAKLENKLLELKIKELEIEIDSMESGIFPLTGDEYKELLTKKGGDCK